MTYVESLTALQWGKVNNMLGLLNFQFRNLQTAQSHYEQAISYLQQYAPDEPIELGITLCNYGNLLYMQEKMSKSLAYFQKGGAILIRKRAKYEKNYSTFLNVTGLLWWK